MPNTDPQLSDRLELEWAALRRHRPAIERARSWGVTHIAFADLDGLLALTGFRVAGTPARNEVLRRIVEVARHDDLAGRVALQRILPGLLGVIRARARHPARTNEFDELVGAAWLAIRCCPTDGRQRQLAGTLVRDAAYRAFTAPKRRRSASEVTVDPRVLDDTPACEDVSPFEELARVVAAGRAAGMPVGDLDLVRDLLRVGSPGRLAADRRVTPRTIRNHRDRITRQLRRLADAS